MASLPTVATRMRTLFHTTAEECARASGCIRRQRAVSGALLVQTLVLGFWLHPTATLHQLTQVAAQLGVRISPQGLDQRFTTALTDCLHRVLAAVSAQVGTSEAGMTPLVSRFTGVYILDSTTISLPAVLAGAHPGCGGGNGGGEAALKLAVLLEVGSGDLGGLEPLAGRDQDRATDLQQMPLPEGSLRLSDLGFFTLGVFRTIGERGGYWLSRLRIGTVVVDADGERVADLGRWLSHQAHDGVVDRWVTLGVRERLPARLVAVRVPQAVADRRRRNLHTEARRKGQAASRASLHVADWTILVTNVPVALLSVDAVLVMQRARWQIEVLFKCWKEHGRLDTSMSAKPERILAEVYAKIIALSLQQWVLAASGFQGPEQSLVKATQTVRAQVVLLIAALQQSAAAVTRVIEGIGRCLAVGCRIEKRVTRPSLAQLLSDPSLTHQLGLP